MTTLDLVEWDAAAVSSRGGLVESMARLINGHRATGMICAAARLRIADVLGADTLDVTLLASRVGCNPDACYRLLRGLASLGIFEETGARQFRNTEASSLLREDGEPSLYGLACMTSLLHLLAWPQLLFSLRTGAPAFPQAFGAGLFDYLAAHPEAADAFDRAMCGYTDVVAGAVLETFDFSGCRRIVDIGGGAGAFLTKIVRRHPHVHGIVYDLPHVVERTRERLRRLGLHERIDAVGGDMFAAVPPGGDLYTIKIVLCDWSDDDAARILRNVRAVIDPDARLLVVDAVIPPGNTPCFAKLSDVNMLVMTGGHERTAEDFRRLLGSSGFEVDAIRRVHDWVGLVGARPA